MPKNKRELKVGDYVRVSRSSRKECVSGTFGMVCKIQSICEDGLYGEGNFYQVEDANVNWNWSNIVWVISKKHLKYAKQANKKAGRNVAEK